MTHRPQSAPAAVAITRVVATVVIALLLIGLAWRFGFMATAGGGLLVAAGAVLARNSNRGKYERREPSAEEQGAILERLQLATQAAAISAWEFNAVERRFVWDTNRPKAFGLDDEPLETLTPKLAALTHPDDRPIVFGAAERAVASGTNTYSIRFRIAREGCPIRHMQSFARVIVDAHGKPARVLGATWDITNEVQQADMLQRQAEQEHSLLERYGIATQAAGVRVWEMAFSPARYTWYDNFDVDWLKEHDPDPLQAVFKLSHPDDRGVFRDAIEEAMRTRSNNAAYRYRYLNRDGTYDWRQNHARLFFDSAGKLVRALGVSWSVSKEMNATELLRATERRMERATRSSSEGHFELDLETQQAWHSDGFHALLGYPPGRLLMSVKEAVEMLRHPQDAERHRARVAASIASGEPYVFEARYRMADGEFRWFKVRGCSELDANGKPRRVAGSIQDIHEQKLAEDALQSVQQRLERAINGTQDGLWEIATDGRDAWYSPRLCALLGFDAAEAEQSVEFLRARIHPDDFRIVADAADAHYKEQAPFDVEIRLMHKSGDYRWYRARAVAARDAQGTPLRLSGSMQDVTEARHSREELVRATEAAQAANLAKSAFLANVSHEIRTPMNGILGMTGLLMETEMDRTQRDYAETIRASADSLLTVINDILDFSKIEAGKLDIESLELDLRSNVEDVGGMMAFQAAAKKLELVVNVHADVPQFVRGDPQRIRQCLINLVGNAIKFTHTGEVVIEVRNQGLSGGKVMTRFEVRDTGIGIAAESLKNLFQPFTQADSSTTRHFGGSGLGLSIVRRLAELMGGETGATSQVGEGSVFWFTLPFDAVGASPRMEARSADRQGKRVLIVDDNHTNRRVLLGQLEQAGFAVEAEANGADALAALRQGLADARPFDIALIDFQMPEMDGATLGEQINNDPSFARTRTIMLTSMDRHGDMRQFAAMGFAGYMSKPVRTGELFACIDRVLTRESPGIVTRNVLHEAATQRRFAGRVLLVEDNAVNQKVARQFLARLGCEVEIADNGEQAVKLFEAGAYALVLMDLQMPIMDGYAATRRIRDFEGWRKRTPIVALTANAMTGQMERCMAAGMDDFLTKPLDVNRLRETLAKFGLAVDVLPNGKVDALLSTPTEAPVAFDRLRAVADNDPLFLAELIEAFVQSSAHIKDELAAALDVFDTAAIGRAAHKLKGASANMHAASLARLCADLEDHAAIWTRTEASEQMALIERALKKAIDFLTTTATHRDGEVRAVK